MSSSFSSSSSNVHENSSSFSFELPSRARLLVGNPPEFENVPTKKPLDQRRPAHNLVKAYRRSRKASLTRLFCSSLQAGPTLNEYNISRSTTTTSHRSTPRPRPA